MRKIVYEYRLWTILRGLSTITNYYNAVLHTLLLRVEERALSQSMLPIPSFNTAGKVPDLRSKFCSLKYPPEAWLF
jgi:hypothetical protein